MTSPVIQCVTLSPNCVTLSLTVSPRHSPGGPQSPSASEGAWSSPQGRHCSAGSGRGPQPPADLNGTERQGHTGTGDEHMLTDRDTHKGTGLALRTGIPYKFPICYIAVGSYSCHKQGKWLMSEFRDRFAYKSPYIVGLFQYMYSHRIPSRNNTTTSDFRQCETRTFVGRSYAEIARSQKGTLR